METNLTISVTRAGDPIRAYLSNGRIPVITLGELGKQQVDLQVNTSLLTPAQQRAWLLDLADKVAGLALLIPAEDDGTFASEYAERAGR